MNSNSPAIRRQGEAFALGVLVMLLVNVLQRSVGLLRGIGFARYLPDAELGQWALANSFLVIAVPIAALGFTGSFGKFVEYFRQRNLFAIYFRLCLVVSIAGSLATCLLLIWNGEFFSQAVFGQHVGIVIVLWCVLCLATSIAASFVSELATGFRQITTVSYMQFAQSFVFAVAGVSLAFVYRTWWVLLPSFALANSLALCIGWIRLQSAHADAFRKNDGGGGLSTVLRRLAPFAASLWFMNLLSNLYEVSDRYMLLHLAEGGNLLGQSLVGQQHCARILPNLLISLGVMLGGVVLPYLSEDWEANRKAEVASRIRQLVQGVALGFLAVSTVALCLAPFMFTFLIDNDYDAAQSILPLVLAQAIWIALFLVAEPFLLCAEKSQQLIAILVVGLGCNLAFNWWMIPHWGLVGATLATAISNILCLVLLLWQLGRCGCPLNTGTILLCATPLALLGGAMGGALALTVLVYVAGRTDWILTNLDRKAIDAALLPKLQKFGLRFTSIWP